MFQRLKGAIDSRIAEEQARQRQVIAAASQPRPSPGQTRRRPAQNGSTRRPSSQQRVQVDQSTEPGPDPSEFEPEFVIGPDDSAVPSRAETPQPAQPVVNDEREDATSPPAPESAATSEVEDKSKADDTTAEDKSSTEEKSKAADTKGDPTSPARPSELPTEVRVKLRKLEKLESKYQELLKAYKTAHARLQTIEPFEASLRENTPLTSIRDSEALVEYLNQINLKSDMVVDELKRVTADRDMHKKKAEESEKSVSELTEQIKKLEETRTSESSTNGPMDNLDRRSSLDVQTRPEEISKETAETASIKSPKSVSSIVPSLSLFSPKFKAKSPPAEDTVDEFFSYDSEVPRLEAELNERQNEVEDLKKQVQSLKGDLAVARESTGSMVQSLETATRELHTLREANDIFSSSQAAMESKITDLEAKVAQGKQLSKELEETIALLKVESSRSEKASQLAAENLQASRKLYEEAEAKRTTSQQLAETLNEKIHQKDAINKDLEDTIAMYKSAERQNSAEKEKISSEGEITAMQGIMDDLKLQLQSAQETLAEVKLESSAKQEEFAKRPSTRVFGFLDDGSHPEVSSLTSKDEVLHYLADTFGMDKPDSHESPQPREAGPSATGDTAQGGGGKRKKSKKKKGKGDQNVHANERQASMPVKVTENLKDDEDDQMKPPPVNESLQNHILQLKLQIEEKDAAIDRLTSRIKDQEGLTEEIETLRDDLLHQGQEHVEARDALKAAVEEKTGLQNMVDSLKAKLKEAQSSQDANAKSEHDQKVLETQLDELKANFTTAQQNLAAAKQLATARFKDITDLRELLSKAQPELRSLRNEVADLKDAKEHLVKKTTEFNRLESQHEDLKSEVKTLNRRLVDKEAEIKDLQAKVDQESTSRSNLEQELMFAKSAQRISEAQKTSAIESFNTSSADLAKAREDLAGLRSRASDLDSQVSKHAETISGLRDDLVLKTTLHASSQSLLQSLRDQSHELSTQAREAITRSESLDEELLEAQRMLSERSREAETMRRLLQQAEQGAEGKLREMRERMESAIEERERIEDEASVKGRKMAREVDGLRSDAREKEKMRREMEGERDEAVDKGREARKRVEVMEKDMEKAKAEIEEVKAALAGMRDALDESERQISELETQRNDLRKAGDDARERVEKLAKTNKTLSDEIKSLQGTPTKRPSIRLTAASLESTGSGVQSSRSSLDSSSATGTTSRSPVPHIRDRLPSSGSTATVTSTAAAGGTASSGTPVAGIDYVYLKNVLLQFLEQKDKSHQRQLIPVLGMLLHFDREDERKWVAAVGGRWATGGTGISSK